MSDNPTKDALYELLDYLEQVETRTGALLQLLRDNEIVTDENFAPYLEQASNATNVKSRAIHARFDYLFNTDQTVRPATEAVPAQAQKQGGQERTGSQGKNEREAGQDAKSAEAGKKQMQSPSEEKPQPSAGQENEPSEIVAGREAAEDHHASKPDKKRLEPDRKQEKDAA